MKSYVRRVLTTGVARQTWRFDHKYEGVDHDRLIAAPGQSITNMRRRSQSRVRVRQAIV
jgi:hypothetical protein